MTKVFIGVAWPYVNGQLHIGHLAGYLFPADIYARYRRLKGDDVLMVSGSDCYGTPITVEADKRGMQYGDLVDEYHPKHQALFATLKIQFDRYTKTATDNHRAVVQDFFVRGLKSGVIYIDSSEQFFDSTTQTFLPDRYVEGECSHCGFKESRSDQCDNCGSILSPEELINPISKVSKQPVILKETQHYYYDWSRGDEFLRNYVETYSDTWRRWSVAETNKWLVEGLKPRAITRDIQWGIDIPEDLDNEFKIEGAEHKKIYVWFEAVIGYLSASIEAYPDTWKQWWYNSDAQHYYYMGKDNLVFHTLFWPYQLHEYDAQIHVPDTVVVNNFLNLEGEKFSKSRGVIIDSADIVEQYGLEVVKFYLTSIMPEEADSNFMYADFQEKVNSVLVANLGNFVYRTSKLLEKVLQQSGQLDWSDNELVVTHIKRIALLLTEAETYLRDNEFKRYLETVLELSALGNKRLQELEPWKIKDPVIYAQTMTTFVPFLVGLGIAIKPIFFDSSDAIAQTLGIDITQWPDDFAQYCESIKSDIVPDFATLQPLFAKIDPKTDNS